jgi:predicted metalloprotease
MLSTVTKSLQTYWARQASGTKTTSAPTVVAASNAPACRGGTDGGVLDDTVTYCPSTNTITYDAKTLQHAHDGIGDFASGALVAAAWSSSVQHQTGHTLGTAAARKGAECLAGAWAANSSTSLSPGDLDEAVTLLVAGNHESTDRGSAFERVAAFRAGYKNGPSRCLV